MDSGSATKVLVVDDERDVCETTAAFLAGLGYAVSCAASGEDALRMVQDDPMLTLLLTDIEMPGELHGFALARQAKAIRPDLRVIYITGYSDLPEFDPHAIHGPIVRKPFRLVHLADKIERALAVAEANLATARRSEAKARHDLDEIRLEAAHERQANLLLRASVNREAANSLAKSRLLTTVGHDLRQPLTVIVGTLEMLADKVDGQPRKLVARAAAAAERLTEAIETILAGARSVFASDNPEFEPIAIGALLDTVVERYRPDAHKKNLSLRLHRTSAVVISDPKLLDQILDNLIGNAIKYTDRGGVLIGCRRRSSRVVVQVWDTGIGIPAGLLDAIFDEYRRASAEGRPGFGLGLAIVKRTCEVLGHQATVRSVVGKGSCFSVELPVAPAAGWERPHLV